MQLQNAILSFMKYGITLIALGYEVYGTYALNMALSLKAYDPHIRVCILYEPRAIAHLTPHELTFFDEKIVLPESEYTINGKRYYHRSKVIVNKYTPWDFTMYMDVDNIWLPDIKPSWLLGECLHHEFRIGMAGHYNVKTDTKINAGYTYWCEPREACKYWGIKNVMPNTISGFYSFHKAGISQELFSEAAKVYDDMKAPFYDWNGGKADEYCFNVAMGRLNMVQPPFHVFYFHKTNGHLEANEIYENFWGIATGGATVPENLIILYNKCVEKYAFRAGLDIVRRHVNKSEVVTERKM